MARRSPQAPQTNLVEYTVSELAFALRKTVEDAYGLVRLRLKFKPEEGLEIVAKGKITIYPGKSTYQIVIDELEPAGVGALMALLERRKKQLAAEGLFDEERKRALPFLPRVIGVVTSPTGAVIRDILHRLSDRFPSHVLVWPARVQGETCAAEVAAAIHGFNADPPRGSYRPDLIIVARGGGSLEDLWGFNEEIVVRAAAASTIPLISAVGHETDWTLIDLVADYRAPTPTAAAERAVPVRSELLVTLRAFGVRSAGSLRRALENWRSRYTASARGLPRRDAILGLPRQRLDSAGHKLPRALLGNARVHRSQMERVASRLRPHLLSRAASSGRDTLRRLDRARARSIYTGLDRARRRLDAQSKLLATLGYHNVLARGFALVRSQDGAMLRRAAEVESGAALDIEFADGHLGAHADPRGTSGKGPASKVKMPAKVARRKTDEEQGSLI